MDCCGCGCGQELKINVGKKGQPYKFLPGHRNPGAPDGRCQCGCGKRIKKSPKHKYRGASYLPGHATRGRPGSRTYTPKPEEIPSGLCECGCGKPTPIATLTNRRRRHFRGHPLPFRHGHTRKKPHEDHHLWKGGRTVDSDGYVYILMPGHPAATRGKGRYVAEHRLVMEQVLGRSLKPSEDVHHINGIKGDNRPDNLVVLTKVRHSAHHRDSIEKMQAALTTKDRKRNGRKGAAARWGKRKT